MPRYLQAILAYCLLGVTHILMTSHPVVGAKHKYIAEVRVYVDKSGLDKWKKETGKSTVAEVRADIRQVFVEMNTIFKSLGDYKLNVQIQLKDIFFIPDEVFNFKKITKPSDQFVDWLYNIYRRKEMNYDLTVLYTGSNIARQYGVLGEATLGSTCRLQSAAVGLVFKVAHKPDIKTRGISLLTAHEIGHLLGARHDQEIPGCPHRGAVMDRAPGSYTFSECSADEIDTKLRKGYGSKCLSTQTRMTADEACQKKEGPDFFLRRGAYKTYGDNFCKELVCISRTSITAKFQTKKSKTPDGLACGKNKECKGGKCVSTTTGTRYMSDQCPWGDQDLLSLAYTKHCSQQDCKRWSPWCCDYCQGK